MLLSKKEFVELMKTPEAIADFDATIVQNQEKILSFFVAWVKIYVDEKYHDDDLEHVMLAKSDKSLYYKYQGKKTHFPWVMG